MRKSIWTLIALVAMGNAQARETNFLFGFSLDFGGDEVGRIVYTDGTKDTLNANDGASLFAGVHYHVSDAWAVQALLGQKTGAVSAKNGSLEFQRVPLTLQVFNDLHPQHRVGGGLTYHHDPVLICDANDACDFELEFDNALGWVVSYQFLQPMANERLNMVIGAQYTNIQYTPDNGSKDADASGPGLTLALQF